MSRKKLILDTVSDLVTSFLYYDRKEDEALPEESIQEAVLNRELSKTDIIEKFRDELFDQM